MWAHGDDGRCLDVLVDQLLQMILVGETDDRFDDFPALEDQDASECRGC